MGRRDFPSHLTLVVNNDVPTPPCDVDEALAALTAAQARWHETGNPEDGEAAKRAYRAAMIATGGDPNDMPLHRWRYR